MGKKTGKKATYVVYGGKEVVDIVNGHMLGISFNEGKKSYYMMIPKALLPSGAKRSKQVWLKSDLDNAVVKFRARVAELKGEQERTISIAKDKTAARRELGLEEPVVMMTGLIDKKSGEVIVKERNVHKIKVSEIVDVPEYIFIQWLRQELQNPSELAKKTGINAFNNFHALALQEQLPLSTLYNNYINSVKYNKITDEDEKQKTKKTWDTFVKLTGKSTLEQITLDDIKAFEKYLHSQKYKERKTGKMKRYEDKTIHHYKSRVSKIFRYNLKEYDNIIEIQRVLDYFNKWEDLEVNSSETIAAQAISHKNFMKLYKAADKKGDLQLKAVLMLCLNTATYIKEVARFKLSDIDMEQQTLMTNRNKKGRCRKFAYLWERTVRDLKAYLDTRTDSSDILFIARHGGEYKDGEGLRTRTYLLRKKCNLLNVEFSHLRDTFQTLANEVGVHQYHSNMVMGHSSGKTSERYSHRRIHNELKEACLAVEKDFFKTTEEN